MKTSALILVIEDDAPVRMLMVRTLEAAGYRVAAVSTALEAVSVLRREPPALLLTDLVLPGLDGANASLSMKDAPGMAAIPVILTSGAPDLEARARESGAEDSIAKPFTPAELVERVRRVLQKGAQGPRS